MTNNEPKIEVETNDSAKRAPQRPRRQRMRLPFDNRKQDAGEWAYDHRIGLSVMVIAYLVLAIAFFASKIVIGSRPHMQGIYVDLQTLAELEAEKERLQREIELKQQQDIDWSAVRNRMSNDALLNENLKDDRGTNTSEINESAKDIAAGMAANRAAYEAGLAEAKSILEAEREKADDGGKSSKGQDAKYKGGVTVRYAFKDPVRTKRDLVIPAYKCEAGGQVEVAVVLNQGGEVISARVISGGDTAPARHSGTITYTFIPQ